MQTILHHIFQKDTLEEVPLDALQQLTTQYPFFAPAQFLLAKKLYQSGQDGFDAQLKKSAIHFNNPLWLEHLLEIPVNNTVERREKPVLALPVETTEEIEANNTEQAEQLGTDLEVPAADGLSDLAPVQQEAAAETDASPAAAEPVATGPLLKDILNGPAQPEEFLLTAFHTVDYFASQGIRLQVDEQQQDKLGKQMKSFTEWLRTMRRLPQAGAPQLEKINEEAILQQASTSLEEKDIVTEAMAEVLVKQQNIQKAALIYHKLGLQYPEKRAYFVAKIEALK